MRITAPVHAARDAASLMDAGADELYCGVEEKGLEFLNARPGPSSNLPSFAELEELCAGARSRGVPVLFCLNAVMGRESFPRQMLAARRAAEAGAAGLIVADPSLVAPLRDAAPGCGIVMSTISSCFNAQTLELFAELGARRAVLDRMLTLGEVGELAARAGEIGIEVEVFVRNITCVHVNAFCTLHEHFHSTLGAEEARRYKEAGSDLIKIPCRRWESVSFLSAEDGGPTGRSCRNPLREPGADMKALYCGLCSMLRLRRDGVHAVKIAGRAHAAERTAANVRLLRSFLDAVESGEVAEDDPVAKGRALHRDIMGRDCREEECFHHETALLRKGSGG